MDSQYGNYSWKPSHDIDKPTIRKGQHVLHNGKVKTVTHVDRHVYPICVDYERVRVEDIELIEEDNE